MIMMKRMKKNRGDKKKVGAFYRGGSEYVTVGRFVFIDEEIE